ncbi:hypothetical protein FRB96_009584 [Tulasnella sp. 330]|nr:hypothetical protein FRB96_009584 [Tulasnella sp. 330]
MGTGAMSWSSKKQTTVALSSTEAEYIATVAAGKELLWMHQLLCELKFKVKGPSSLMMDNQSAIASMKNPEHHGRMKHLDVSHHWIRDEVQCKTISVKYLDTNSMVADILTKPLAHNCHDERSEVLLDDIKEVSGDGEH